MVFNIDRTWNNRAPESLPFVLLTQINQVCSDSLRLFKICPPVAENLQIFSAISLIYNNINLATFVANDTFLNYALIFPK